MVYHDEILHAIPICISNILHNDLVTNLLLFC